MSKSRPAISYLAGIGIIFRCNDIPVLFIQMTCMFASVPGLPPAEIRVTKKEAIQKGKMETAIEVESRKGMAQIGNFFGKSSEM